MAGNMDESKILITNYPNLYQHLTLERINNKQETIEVRFGYDFKINRSAMFLQMTRDLITALLSFDKIYIEGNSIWNIIPILGCNGLKELLRLHILYIIPDQDLNPVVITENNICKYDFFSYILGKEEINESNIHRWSYVENILNQYKFDEQEKRIILYLIDENSVNLRDEKEVKRKIKEEVKWDIKNLESIFNPNFCRIRYDGEKEYYVPDLIRLQELNKSVILASMLNIDNIKMDAAINELMLRKTASAFSKDIHVGTDALIRIEQQKGFPDLGELFVKGIIGLNDILKLRNDFQGKIFRYWMQKSDYEEQLMQQEIMNSVQNILGAKCINPIRFIGTNLIGLFGFIPGIVASAFDSFILDKILKGWHPNFFLDDKLKTMIDDCIIKEKRKCQKEKLDKAFKGVGRNDPCPCGSGKKYKKCHGKDL
ncbi:SEC-C domain-containing protein [uncultured Phocaeicola sp.]|uniref:YecA family protein n=1 Tax=uncultured Phocaeicola sp. TaxID=990718 RepID=UPI002595D5E4|nr:SEC-C domain-containing protein [uncultured Phocaeicola sp.]